MGVKMDDDKVRLIRILLEEAACMTGNVPALFFDAASEIDSFREACRAKRPLPGREMFVEEYIDLSCKALLAVVESARALSNLQRLVERVKTMERDEARLN